MQAKKIINFFGSRIQGLIKQGFVRSVSVLVGGTAFAQALTLLALPFVTRLYSPEDFSALAVYSAIAVIFTVVASLRFEIAIPIPDRDQDAINLLALAICSCTGACLLASVAIWNFPDQITELMGQNALRPYLWTLPPAIWLAGTYVALTFWATRKRRFVSVAKTRVQQAVGSVGAQLAFGIWGAGGPIGLIVGQVISSAAGAFALGRSAWTQDKESVFRINRSEMRRLCSEYDRFPKYSTFDALASSAGLQLPVIIIAAFATGAEAGYLLLAMRTMAAPLGLIGSAVSQVYLAQAGQEMRDGRLSVLTANVLGGLAKAGVGPILCIGLVASEIFPLVFGSQWDRAGDLVLWMTPWFLFQFLSNPISMAMQVTGSQRNALAIQVFGLLLRVSVVSVVGVVAAMYIVEAYAISCCIFYLVHLVVLVKSANISAQELSSAMKPAIPIIFSWIFLGVAIKTCLLW